MIRSLRMRLFLGTTLVSAILLSILCFTIIASQERTLEAEFDKVLLEKARTLASLVQQSGDGIHFDYRRSLFPEFELGAHPDYFEIILDGKPYARSPSLDFQHLTISLVPPPASPQPPPPAPPITIMMPHGGWGRQIELAFQPLLEDGPAAPSPPHTAVLALAMKTDVLTARISHLRTLVISLCAAATLLSGVALLLMVNHAVAPVKSLASQIEAVRISTGNAAPQTILAAPFPLELSPIVDRLNDLMGRLTLAFSRERAFTADAAHELRTPLAGLLTTLEVCRTRPRSSVEFESAIDKCLAILRHMQGMIEKLLLLSRAEGGQVRPHAGPVDVRSIALDAWQSLEAAARTRDIVLKGAGERAAPPSGEGSSVIGAYLALADPELMQIVFTNLFDNAISYARRHSAVDMQIARKGDRLQVVVASIGHELSAEDVPRLFERFWRKDSSRAATGIHAGLGLSLCQRLLVLQNGKIGVRIVKERFAVELDLPAPV